jgi:hypothetical protein
VFLGGRHNRLTGCRFDRSGDGGPQTSWRHIIHVPAAASYNLVDSNHLVDSRCIPMGQGEGGDIGGHNAFTHNLIEGNDLSAPGSWRVAIQIGQSGGGERTFTRVAWNTIRRFDGPESVGIKSSDCIVEHNLIVDSSAPLGVRAGSDNRLLGNVMLGCHAGIMLTGRGHLVEGNYIRLDREFEGGLGAIFLHHEAWKEGIAEPFYQATTGCTIRGNVLMVLPPNRHSPPVMAFAWLADVRGVPHDNRFEGNTIVSYIGGPPLLAVQDASKRTALDQFVAANTFVDNRFWASGADSPAHVPPPAGLDRGGNRVEDPGPDPAAKAALTAPGPAVESPTPTRGPGS